jgi:hypothetical protein
MLYWTMKKLRRGGSIHGLGSNGTDRWVRDSHAGQGGFFKDLVIGTSSANARLPPMNKIDLPFHSFPFSVHRSEGITPATIEAPGMVGNNIIQQQ